MANRQVAGLFLLSFIAFCSCLPHILRGRPRGGLVGSPRGEWNGELPPDMWFVQQLNHFNDADNRTWTQRYFVNDTFYKPGGPVFLMIGGEGTADPIWMVMGAWINYAQKYHALCLQLEHRYYGKSHPVPDMSTENLAYLSSEQALADLATFRNAMAEKYNVSSNKWISFGGSYPGSLSAWFRLKYPHLVHAAVATSAPIYAKLNFLEYLDVVRDSLDTTGKTCNKAIDSATRDVLAKLGSDQGRKELKAKFMLCDDIEVSNLMDVSTLFANLAGNFEGIVQYNKDNRAFEGAVDTNVTIDVLCAVMKNTSIGTELDRYAAVNSLILKTYSQQCQNFKYEDMIKELSATGWETTAGEGGRQWMYQTCTEFGFYQTSDLPNQPFGHKFPLSYSVQQCKDIFGATLTQAIIEGGIKRTNTNYGGYGLTVTRVVFPNGSIDPWHALGVTKDLSKSATALFINGTAHCANMYPETDKDLPALKDARAKIDTLIGQWLQES